MELTKIGKYERLNVLGHGKSGIVYLAKDTHMGREVALKVVEADTSDLQPFFNEARLLARLHHPNIVTVHGSDLIGSEVVVDMEYIPGVSLRQLLRDKKRLSVERSLKILAQILNALDYAHTLGSGVIHRDIKPANILIGQNDLAKVVDFGIADVLGTQGYLHGAGTYSHMAPECFLDKSDQRSDIYSVGVILYEMLTGQLPFQAASNSLTAWEETLDKQETPKPLTDFLPDVPNGLQTIINLSLNYDKRKRFRSAENFLERLKRNGLYLLPNTEDELRQVDRFEAAYNRIDKHLRQELVADRITGFADVVRQYAQQHPEWRSEQDLLRLGRVRNKLRHEFTEADQYRSVPSIDKISQIEGIARRLRGDNPEEYPQQPEENRPTIQNEVDEQGNIEPITIKEIRSGSVLEDVVNVRELAITGLANLSNTHSLILEAMRRADWQRFTTPKDAQNLLGGAIDPILYTTRDIRAIEFLAEQVDTAISEMLRLFVEGLKQEISERMRMLAATQSLMRKKQEEFSARWYEADKKKRLDLSKNKKMTSGLTPKSIFYRTSEGYVSGYLKPTVAQNIQDQYNRALEIIDAERQQMIPPLEDNVRLATIIRCSVK